MNPQPRLALLDTNLLLLWLVARVEIRLLQELKRVRSFTYQDIELLKTILKPFSGHVTTPHVLTETSNFVDQAPSWRRTGLADELRIFVLNSTEAVDSAESLMQHTEYNKLGLTDTALAALSHKVTVGDDGPPTGGTHTRARRSCHQHQSLPFHLSALQVEQNASAHDVRAY